MILDAKCTGALVLRLIGGLALLGCTQISRAAGTWSVISLLPKPGEVSSPGALAVDAAGNLYVGEQYRIEKRDAQGSWSVISTTGGTSPLTALAVDVAGDLYVADYYLSRIQRRDAQGNWSVIAGTGSALGQVVNPRALAVDPAGSLYVADSGASSGNIYGRIQKRDAQGHWSVIATAGTALGQVTLPASLAAGATGNLYVAESPYRDALGRIQNRILKRDAQGHWSVIDTQGASALAVDDADDLYAAGGPIAGGAIQKRDAHGHWSVIASLGTGLGQVALGGATALAVDIGGNLYVADPLTNAGGYQGRIQKRGAQGAWSLVAIPYGDAPGEVVNPTDIAVDAAGNLYVSDWRGIEERNAQGNWSIIAEGVYASALATDTVDNLLVLDVDLDNGGYQIQKRDARGNWSAIVDGQFSNPDALVVDRGDNLYVAEQYRYDLTGGKIGGASRIQKRDPQGNWSVMADVGFNAGEVVNPRALAVDVAGNLYVAETGYGPISSRIQKQDAQGDWSEIATAGSATGQVGDPSGLAVDRAGSLYVADYDNSGYGRIQKRDAEGNWSLIATSGLALSQGYFPAGLAVDGAGNLYVTDTGNNRVLKYLPDP